MRPRTMIRCCRGVLVRGRLRCSGYPAGNSGSRAPQGCASAALDGGWGIGCPSIPYPINRSGRIRTASLTNRSVVFPACVRPGSVQ